MTDAEPFRIAVGLQNTRAMIDLSVQLAEYRSAHSFKRPIFVHGGRASVVQDGFVGLHDILWSAIVHANDVRVHRGADIALGLVHGTLYIPRDGATVKITTIFDTALLVVTDADGIVDWVLPQEARPQEADHIHTSMSSLVDPLKKKRKVAISKEMATLTNCLLAAVLFHIRPLPSNFGVLRPIQ